MGYLFCHYAARDCDFHLPCRCSLLPSRLASFAEASCKGAGYESEALSSVAHKELSVTSTYWLGLEVHFFLLEPSDEIIEPGLTSWLWSGERPWSRGSSYVLPNFLVHGSCVIITVWCLYGVSTQCNILLSNKSNELLIHAAMLSEGSQAQNIHNVWFHR